MGDRILAGRVSRDPGAETVTHPKKERHRAPLSGWRAFLHEQKRLLRQPGMMVVIIVIALFLLVAVGGLNPYEPQPSVSYSSAVTYGEGSYIFSFFAYNQFGQGVSGVPFSLTVSPMNYSNTYSRTASGATNSEGMLQLTATLPLGNYTADGYAGPQSNPEFFQRGLEYWFANLSLARPGELEPTGGPITGAVDIAKGFTQTPGLQVFYPLPSISPTNPAYVYYKEVDLQNFEQILPESAMSRLGAIHSSLSVFPLTLPMTQNSTSLDLQVELFSASGQVLWTDTNQTVGLFYPINSAESVSKGMSTFVDNFFTPFLGLIAFVAAYITFGRERVSGVLQSVVVRPVTQEGVVLRRYFSLLATLLVTAGLTLLLADGLAKVATGFYVQWTVLPSGFAGAVVVCTFFSALTFLMTGAIRRAGPALMLGIGLFVLLYVFWGNVTSIITVAAGVFPGTPASQILAVHLEFDNPLYYSTLVQYYAASSVPYLTIPPGPSQYGITFSSLLVAGVVWTVPPVIALASVFRRVDA